MRAVADLGTVGFANGDGGMTIRGESGLVLEPPFELACDIVLWFDALDV